MLLLIVIFRQETYAVIASPLLCIVMYVLIAFLFACGIVVNELMAYPGKMFPIT